MTDPPGLMLDRSLRTVVADRLLAVRWTLAALAACLAAGWVAGYLAAVPALVVLLVVSVIAVLAPGSLVDLYSHSQWRRAKLVWASGKGSLFMFQSEAGRPHSMTRRSLQRLVRERLVRPVDGEAVVPRALQKITKEERQAA